VKESHVEEDLVKEFAGVFSRETVTRCFRETAKKWADAPIQSYVDLFAQRFTRERLRAEASAS
jgi:hypothetical protein